MRKLKRINNAFWSVLVVHIRSTTFFRAKLVVDISMTIFRVFVLLFLYMNIYKIAPSANDVLPYKAALWSIGVYFIALAFSARRMFSFVSDLIYTGNIETYLVRPLHVLLFTTARLIGENTVQIIVASAAILTVLFVFVGVPTTGFTVPLVAIAILLLLLGVILDILIAMLIGLFALWMENSKPIYWIADKFILILGGSYVPVAFFPEFLKVVSVYSPFGATRFASYAFYPDFSQKVWQYLTIQLVWIVIFFYIIKFTYKKGQHHLFVNGS